MLFRVKMAKGLSHYLREAWKQTDSSHQSAQWNRLIKWRREDSVVRVDRPTRPDRAHSLGYKAKQGFIIVRSRIRKGSRQKQRPKGGRRPARMGVRKITGAKSIQRMAEERAAKHHPNLEVLNSYKVGADGRRHYYEVILVDPSHPAVVNDDDINWITRENSRVHKGKTSAGKKGRGLRTKGKGAEHIRPSVSANDGRSK